MKKTLYGIGCFLLAVFDFLRIPEKVLTFHFVNTKQDPVRHH